MDMINLREAPIVDKAEEGATLFVLNPDGTINRISAKNVKSEINETLVIKVNVAGKEFDGKWEEEVDVGYTLAELREAITSGDVMWANFGFIPTLHSGASWYINLTVRDDAITSDNPYIDLGNGYDGYYRFVYDADGARVIYNTTAE